MKLIYLLLFALLVIQLNAQQGVAPVKDANGYYSFQVGNTFFQVNPKHGARIISHKLDQNEFLWTSNEVADMYGSTCWLSPQSLWGWPPQKQIDSDAYTGGVAGNKLILTSAIATAGNVKFQIRKTFSANIQDTSVSIVYSIINRSSAARSFAVWEIMRVPTGGLSAFPLNGNITGDLASFFTIDNGVAFWDYDSTENNKNKAFADGNGGWLAHVNNNRVMQIKKFPDTQSNFVGDTEKEIEFYADGGMHYNEIEKHTDYKLIPVNDSSVLSMTWYLRKLPENISMSEGNSEFANYITTILNSASNSIKTTPSTKVPFSISPNPSSGEIVLHGPVSNEKISFVLINILGETVTKRIVSAEEKIHLGSLKNGIYLYRLQSEGNVFSGKLVFRE